MQYVRKVNSLKRFGGVVYHDSSSWPIRSYKGHTLLACSMVCNKSWNPKLVWHPAEGGCVDTMHLKESLVLCGSEGSPLTLPLFPLSIRISMLCHCSSTMTKDPFLVTFYRTKWPFCVNVPLNPHSFIHGLLV